MLVGYVSDENYVALSDVALEFQRNSDVVATHSCASGAVYAEIAPGHYQVVLSKSGYGAKRVDVILTEGKPIQFRLISDTLAGYMWPKYVRTGDVAEYRVHSPEQFRLDLYRYGWTKEFIRSYGWCDEHGPRAMAQVVPDGDFTQTGMRWNRVGYGLEFQRHRIVAPERTGLYYLHAKTLSGQFFSFPWIVSPREPTSDIAVLASKISWNAYNNFGGRSNCFSQDGLAEKPIVHARQDLSRYTNPDVWPYTETAAPLSFERPEIPSHVPEDSEITTPIAGRMNSAFAPGEWRLLGWMEREGFQYDLYSEVELHFDRIRLEDYKVLILNTHPEYWSEQMYHRVKDWVFNGGGKLMYLAACGFYAEVEFADEQTVLCRREGEFSQRGEPAVNLLGIAYSHSGFQTAAPYRVINDRHWVYQDTGLTQGDLFGLQNLHERCPGGASGHELDKISDESPKNLIHLAKGTNPEESGADMIIFDTPSGGQVFSVGSMCWTLSLPIDDGVSAVTANVLRRFTE